MYFKFSRIKLSSIFKGIGTFWLDAWMFFLFLKMIDLAAPRHSANVPLVHIGKSDFAIHFWLACASRWKKVSFYSWFHCLFLGIFFCMDCSNGYTIAALYLIKVGKYPYLSIYGVMFFSLFNSSENPWLLFPQL